jgi:hypothetical protein
MPRQRPDPAAWPLAILLFAWPSLCYGRDIFEQKRGLLLFKNIRG